MDALTSFILFFQFRVAPPLNGVGHITLGMYWMSGTCLRVVCFLSHMLTVFMLSFAVHRCSSGSRCSSRARSTYSTRRTSREFSLHVSFSWLWVFGSFVFFVADCLPNCQAVFLLQAEVEHMLDRQKKTHMVKKSPDCTRRTNHEFSLHVRVSWRLCIVGVYGSFVFLLLSDLLSDSPSCETAVIPCVFSAQSLRDKAKFYLNIFIHAGHCVILKSRPPRSSAR